MHKYWQFLVDRAFRFDILAARNLLIGMSDRTVLEKKFYYHLAKKLDWENPVTFNEKLQWLKLYNQRPEYTAMVDKYEVKKYVADRIGEEYVIPALGVWERFDDICLDALPDSFVLKCTHDCGSIVFCKDKKRFDKNAARKQINRSLQRNYYWHGREWPYKNIKPRILAEPYMEDTATGELRDYKFFCFGGEPKALFVATERQKAGEDVKFDFFDMEYNHLPLRNGHDPAKVPPAKPQHLAEMVALARRLSENIPHVRVDFYEINGKVYFGEMTFFHFSGFVPFEPEEWDELFGSWIELPEKRMSE